MNRVILDSGAVTLLADARSLRLRVARLARLGWRVTVPAVILSEVVTGTARDHGVNRILATIGTEVTCESVARLAGRLRTRARRRSTIQPSGIDALVAAHAADVDERAIVLTSDPDDLRMLLADYRRVEVERA